MICFDAIFPEINVAFARKALEPELLVNSTNDAWYGYSSGPYQFLAIVRMRAIEAGKAVVRPRRTRASRRCIAPDRRARARARSRSAQSISIERPIPDEPPRLLVAEVPRLRGHTPTLESATSSPTRARLHRRVRRSRAARAAAARAEQRD